VIAGRIAIVGASLAGLNAGLELRRAGFTGELVIIGDEPHRPYDRPPLSKELLRGDWPNAQADLRFEEAELRAEWWLGKGAASLDAAARRIGFDDGSIADFDGIVIATGAAPRILPGCDLAGVHVLRSLSDMTALRDDLGEGARVAVIGAGFVGQEVAASCRAMGLPVTMIEATAPSRHVVGEDLAMRIAGLHRRQGVDVRLGVSVAALEGEGRLQRIRLSDGSIVDATVAVVGIGVHPGTDWLEGSGLTIDNGVLCDETCLAAPGIVACGDVARWPNRRYGEFRRVEHWDNAVRMGVHAARRLLAADGDDVATAPYIPVPWFWSDQYGLKMQLVGSAIDHHEVRIVDDPDGGDKILALFRRDNRLTAVFGISNAKRILTFRKLLEHDPAWHEGLAAAGIATSVAA
jgi:3-phenylpropionate/trans-cinnamate dioxygenase ferredoxin reductase subunit